MEVRIRLFARARDLARQDAIQLQVPPGATIGDLRWELAAVFPSLGAILPRCALAVNDEFAEDSAPLPPDAEIALLPPVSGG
jgi:molybdopterin converting factor subunit 1